MGGGEINLAWRNQYYSVATSFARNASAIQRVTKQPECVSQTKHKATRHPTQPRRLKEVLKKELRPLYDCLLLSLAADCLDNPSEQDFDWILQMVVL